jgi:hypothetical protein
MNIHDVKKLEWVKNILEFAISNKFYDYRNIGVLGILFFVTFSH